MKTVKWRGLAVEYDDAELAEMRGLRGVDEGSAWLIHQLRAAFPGSRLRGPQRAAPRSWQVPEPEPDAPDEWEPPAETGRQETLFGG